MMAALASGVLLGLSAGVSFGPMLALVLAQTLQRGSREGSKIAPTPLVISTARCQCIAKPLCSGLLCRKRFC